MQVTESFNNLMFSIRTDFVVDSACWILAGGVLFRAACSLSLLTSSASESPLLDRKNSYIPLTICDLKLRALGAARKHRSVRTAPRAPHRSPLRSHRCRITSMGVPGRALRPVHAAKSPRLHVPPTARMRVGGKAQSPLIHPPRRPPNFPSLTPTPISFLWQSWRQE